MGVKSTLRSIDMQVTLPQDISSTGSPIFANITDNGLTASRLIFTDANKKLVSGNTDITAAELEELTDGSDTTKHSHPVGANGTFVGRGDPASQDFTSFTTNGTWVDLNLSAIVPAGAKAVLLRVEIQWSAASHAFAFRKNGQANTSNIAQVLSQVANVTTGSNLIVECDSNRVVEYMVPSTAFAGGGITVRGWWT